MRLFIQLILPFCVSCLMPSLRAQSIELTFDELMSAQNSLIQGWEKDAVVKKLEYSWDGYVNTKGKLSGDKRGLACSSFVVPVLTAMMLNRDFRVVNGRKHPVFGEDFRWVHQWFGTDIAEYYGLSMTHNLTLAEFEVQLGEGEIDEGLYLFDILNSKAVSRSYYAMDGDGNQVVSSVPSRGYSHVGFVNIEKNRAAQIHFSGLKVSEVKVFNGLATGDFVSDFINRSLYGKSKRRKSSSRIHLYPLLAYPTARVNTSSSPLTLRASINGGKVAAMPKGSIVQVVAKPQNGWFKVRFLDNGAAKTGFASSKYLVELTRPDSR